MCCVCVRVSRCDGACSALCRGARPNAWWDKVALLCFLSWDRKGRCGPLNKQASKQARKNSTCSAPSRDRVRGRGLQRAIIRCRGARGGRGRGCHAWCSCEWICGKGWCAATGAGGVVEGVQWEGMQPWCLAGAATRPKSQARPKAACAWRKRAESGNARGSSNFQQSSQLPFQPFTTRPRSNARALDVPVPARPNALYTLVSGWCGRR